MRPEIDHVNTFKNNLAQYLPPIVIASAIQTTIEQRKAEGRYSTEIDKFVEEVAANTETIIDSLDLD